MSRISQAPAPAQYGVPGLVSQIVINVRDYGAAGNGTADDTAAIQAAINAVPSGGGVVYLPAGRYLVTSTLTIAQDNTSLLGAGTGQRSGATQTGNGTRIEVGGSISGSVILVQNTSGTTPVYGTRLGHFTIDGKLVGTAVDGIVLRSNRSHTEHVHVHKMSGSGMRLLGYGAPTFNTYDSIVAFCQFGDNAADGFCFDSNSADGHMTSCILFNNNYNIRILASSQQITSCHTYNATTDNIKFDGGGSRTKIVNCKIEGAGQHGINIDSTNGGYSDIQITGNGLSTNGDSLDNAYDHIIIQGPSANGTTRTTIVGNNFGWKSSQTANKNRYGVNMNSSCAQGTVVMANSFGPTASIGTAWINNNSSTTTPATIKNNGNAADDPAGVFINVMDAPYFARGNGSTDDTAAIQSALNAVPSTGGIVYLPGGRYKVSSSLVIQTDNTTLMGAGAGNRSNATQVGAGSRIESASTMTGVPIVLVQRALLDRTVYAPKIVDVAIDGGNFGTGVDGIHWEGVRGELDNVAVHLCSGYVVVVVGYSSWLAQYNRFVSCDFSYNTLAGMSFTSTSNASDNKLIGCVLSNNGQDGIYNAQSGLQVDTCDIYSNSRHGLFFDSGGSRSRTSNCRIRLNANHGMLMDSTTTGLSEVSVVGCGFDTNGTATTNTFDCLALTGPSGNAISRVSIVGNNFAYQSGSSPNKPRYGVNLNSTASQSTVVTGNTFGPASHWGTAPIKNSSSSTLPAIVRHNNGCLTEAQGTATVLSGTTSIAVTHGLAFTPAAGDISVTPTNNLGSAAKFWVSAVGATTFTINTDVNPGATTATFAWQVNIH